MKQLQQLINQMCPNGVEWKTLGEVCEIITKGTTPHSFTDNGIAFIKTEAFLENGIDKNKLSFIDEETHNGFLKRSILKENDILFAIAGSIGKCVVVNKSILPANTNQALAIIRLKSSVLYRFVFYVLKSMIMTSYIEKKCKTSGQPNLTLELIRDFQIPLPPLAIQSRIVEILDNFTNLTANLTAELALRRKQFEYYREKLLSLDGVEGVEWKKLGEICDNISGFPFDSSKFVDNGVRLMRGMNVKRGYFDFNNEDDRFWKDSKGLEKYLLENNDIIISMDGSLVGKSFGLLSEKYLPLLLVQRVARIRAKKADTHYVYHNIRMSFPEYVQNKKTAGAIPHISMKDINNFTIPVPPLEVQKHIVSILDKFTALIENIEKELVLRQKQYEYYREELLRFGG